ncbi:MAG: caspase family protein [Thermoanaerobaculia bacterium]
MTASPQLARALALTGGLLLALTPIADPAAAKSRKAKPRIEDAADLRIVDCLLPSKIRRLGRRANYATPRRPIRTAAADCEIRGGDYVVDDPGSYASALEVWRPAAEAGDPKAQAYVGEIYEKGLTGTPDYEIAAIWYKRAAEAGFSRGQINLANLYEKGLGVPRDREQALHWYRQAAGITEDVVLDSRAEAEALRRELDEATRETARLEAGLKASEESLESARSQLDGARREMEGLRRQLEEARTSGAADTASSLSEELQHRETEIAEHSRVVEQRSEDVASQRQAFADFRQRVAAVRDAAADRGVGPSIEIIRPDVLATRGPALVPVPAGVREMLITGKVSAPAGLAELIADGRPLSPNADGFFETTIVWAQARREVAFEARDRAGRRTRATLVLQPAGLPLTGEQSPTDGGPSSATGSRPRSGAAASRPRTDSAGGDGVRRRALIIGVANYRSFPGLATAAGDAEELAEVLSAKYGFDTRVLEDPTHLALLLELKGLSESLDADDELLIYYAGHGKIDQQRGYWIPADADSTDSGRWIPNETISDYLDLIPARHVLVISDSCYSGTLTRSGLARTATETDEASAVAGKRSRTVLTSGGLQPVLDAGGGDHSIFAGALLTVLKLNDRPLAGVNLHREVAARVTWAASALGVEQVPDYAPIRFAGHETGDFVLIPRRAAKSSSASISP